MLETFTPSTSGALATIIWECCRMAAAKGETPIVLTRRTAQESFPWPVIHFVDPTLVPKTRTQLLVCRAERKFTGWRYFRHRAYAHRVVDALSGLGAHRETLVLFNEPETAVLLRRKFPFARIVHWFQNQLECKPGFRQQFAAAADVILGVSNFTSRWVEQYYGLGHGSVTTVNNGVDLDQFTPATSSTIHPPTIGFVGRTGIEKGPDLLLQAALQLRKRGRDFRLRLIGSNHWDRFELDDYQRQLVGLVQQLGDAGVEVDRPGHIGRGQLAAEIRKSQIHVVPARWDEPFGMTTLEGMACGLAVVASRTGGTPEVLGDAGLYFDRESVEQLTDQLDHLLTHPMEVTRWGSAARTRALGFSWSRVWDELSAAAAVN